MRGKKVVCKSVKKPRRKKRGKKAMALVLRHAKAAIVESVAKKQTTFVQRHRKHQ